MSAIKTQMIGDWTNELGSILRIEKFENSTFEGKYYTEVGNVKKDVFNPLTGTYQITDYTKKDEPLKAFMMSWIVQWLDLKDKTKPPSSTTWNSQVLLDEKGNPTEINSMWLLRSASQEKDTWDGSRIGKDVFHKKSV